MKPGLGVSIEIVCLVGVLAVVLVVPAGTLVALYILVAEFAATFLIHCPAHYIVGRILGIRFTNLRVGRTTLARVLPPRAAGLARLVPILTLSTDRASLSEISKGRAAAMYASGTIASTSSALVVAGGATLSEPLVYAALAWAFALIYLVFDIIFSPRTGDLRRARAALGR
jgi:hypothetical protein